MKSLLRNSFLTATLTFASAGLFLANAQQLQSDGTMSQPTAQTQQPQAQTQQNAPAPAGMPRHMHHAAHEAKHLSRQLGLTPDQSAQLQPLLAERDSRIAALHADNTLDPRAMHRQGHVIERDTQSKINAILTPAQQQTYADLRAAHRKAHDGPAGAPPAAPGA